MLDEFDLALLAVLSENGRASWTQLSEQVNLSPSACQRRVQAMQERGVIKHFSLVLDAETMGQEVRAFVGVKVERHNLQKAAEFRKAILAYPEVQACHKLSGNTDFILDLVAPNLKSFGEFIEQKILSLAGVIDASSSIVLEEVKTFAPMIPLERRKRRR